MIDALRDSAGRAVDALYALARPLLFRLDAEDAHELLVAQIERWQSVPALLNVWRSVCAPRLEPTEVLGLRFRNHLGIAAGFDKNGRMIAFLEALGFGFIELGTVTVRAQPGNPRPRMFRFPKQCALINRLGFNNEGADALVRRIDTFRKTSSSAVPLFVNIGKNADVPLAGASADYLSCYEIVAEAADAVVVNVSSPNTPSLRDLQSTEHLRRIFEELRAARARRGLTHPLILKIAPDLTEGQLAEIVAVAVEVADGITATNTTVDKSSVPAGAELPGGLSGRPLRDRATEMMRRLRRMAGPDYPLIGVGGISDTADARERISAGADLIQVYTGFIYGGPMLASRILGRPGSRSIRERGKTSA